MLTAPGFDAIHSEPIFAPCKGIQDKIGFWLPSYGFRIPGTGYQILVSGFRRLVGFRIPKVLFWISKPRILDSTSNFFPDSGSHKNIFSCFPGIRIPLALGDNLGRHDFGRLDRLPAWRDCVKCLFELHSCALFNPKGAGEHNCMHQKAFFVIKNLSIS